MSLRIHSRICVLVPLGHDGMPERRKNVKKYIDDFYSVGRTRSSPGWLLGVGDAPDVQRRDIYDTRAAWL